MKIYVSAFAVIVLALVTFAYLLNPLHPVASTVQNPPNMVIAGIFGDGSRDGDSPSGGGGRSRGGGGGGGSHRGGGGGRGGGAVSGGGGRGGGGSVGGGRRSGGGGGRSNPTGTKTGGFVHREPGNEPDATIVAEKDPPEEENPEHKPADTSLLHKLLMTINYHGDDKVKFWLGWPRRDRDNFRVAGAFLSREVKPTPIEGVHQVIVQFMGRWWDSNNKYQSASFDQWGRDNNAWLITPNKRRVDNPLRMRVYFVGERFNSMTISPRYSDAIDVEDVEVKGKQLRRLALKDLKLGFQDRMRKLDNLEQRLIIDPDVYRRPSIYAMVVCDQSCERQAELLLRKEDASIALAKDTPDKPADKPEGIEVRFERDYQPYARQRDLERLVAENPFTQCLINNSLDVEVRHDDGDNEDYVWASAYKEDCALAWVTYDPETVLATVNVDEWEALESKAFEMPEKAFVAEWQLDGRRVRDLAGTVKIIDADGHEIATADVQDGRVVFANVPFEDEYGKALTGLRLTAEFAGYPAFNKELNIVGVVFKPIVYQLGAFQSDEIDDRGNASHEESVSTKSGTFVHRQPHLKRGHPPANPRDVCAADAENANTDWSARGAPGCLRSFVHLDCAVSDLERAAGELQERLAPLRAQMRRDQALSQRCNQEGAAHELDLLLLDDLARSLPQAERAIRQAGICIEDIDLWLQTEFRCQTLGCESAADMAAYEFLNRGAAALHRRVDALRKQLVDFEGAYAWLRRATNAYQRACAEVLRQ
jgi:hypothetical protein